MSSNLTTDVFALTNHPLFSLFSSYVSAFSRFYRYESSLSKYRLKYASDRNTVSSLDYSPVLKSILYFQTSDGTYCILELLYYSANYRLFTVLFHLLFQILNLIRKNL